MTPETTASLRRAILIVALANLAYFGVEFFMARRIGSVSLFADSVDFLEDTSVNLLILVALSWTPNSRAKVGMGLAALLLVPGLATLWTIVTKFTHPQVPDASLLSITGLGALGINLACAFLLARYREHAGSLTRAAFLSARNDALANIAIIIAGLATAATHRVWPDLIVGLAIAAMNIDAAKEVWQAARREGTEAKA